MKALSAVRRKPLLFAVLALSILAPLGAIGLFPQLHLITTLSLAFLALAGLYLAARTTAADAVSSRAEYLEQVPTPVMAVDRDFNVIHMNEAGASAVGRSPSECEGRIAAVRQRPGRPALAVLCLFSVLGPLLSPVPGASQGISSILQKLEELEARLARLDASHERDMARLNSRISEKTEEARVELSSGTLDSLEIRVAGLEEDVRARRAQVRDERSMNRTLDSLQADLRKLIPEIRAMAAGRPGAGQDVGRSNDGSDSAKHHDPPQEQELPSPQPNALPGGLDITGFVDASYSYQNVSPLGTSFGLDQAEINLARTLGKRGSLRMDVEFVNDGSGGFALGVEQGYVTFQPLVATPVTATFGKFNAPIGFELLDAPDMYQYSHALVFNYGLPTNLTGAMISAELPWGGNLTVHASNGWDEDVELGGGKTVGGRLGLSREGFLSAGLSGIVDVGVPEDGVTTRVLDGDVTLTPRNDWTLGGEVNRGLSETDDESVEWWGFLLMAHHDFTQRYGVTLRYDFFDDEDGTRLGSGLPETRQALALAPTVALGNGMGALVEFRADWSDAGVFGEDDDELDRTRVGLAFEMTYSF